MPYRRPIFLHSPFTRLSRLSYNGLAATVATDLRTRVCEFLRLYSRARALPDDRTPPDYFLSVGYCLPPN